MRNLFKRRKNHDLEFIPDYIFYEKEKCDFLRKLCTETPTSIEHGMAYISIFDNYQEHFELIKDLSCKGYSVKKIVEEILR